MAAASLCGSLSHAVAVGSGERSAVTALPAVAHQPQGNSIISPTCSEALRGSGWGRVDGTFHGSLGFAELGGSREASSKGPLEKGVREQHGLRCC